MAKMSNQQYEQAANFLRTRARKLDRLLFEYEFECGDPAKVLAELETYQNPDGGFGHGLEPDFRCPASSALATSIAFQVLVQLEADESEEIVKRAINYLVHTYDSGKMGWQIVPKEVGTAPRAVWWNYNEEWKWGNPSAELLGYLHYYNEMVPPELLIGLTDHAVRYINQLETYEHHELLCFIRLAEQLPEQERAQISGKLIEMVVASVTTDPTKWNTYCLLPLQVVHSPVSEFQAYFKESIPLNLNFLVARQHPSGYWEPTWSWGQFEQEWEEAKEEWRGSLTLANLRTLTNFDYIEKEEAL